MLSNINKAIVVSVSSVIVGFAYNMFLIPHEVLSSGVTGIAFIIGMLVEGVNAGLMIALLNIPILVAGYKTLGRKLIIFSVLSVAVTSVSMQFIPKMPVADDPLLSAIFGGAIAGIGAGLIFKSGASSGGFDVIGLIILQKKELPLGTIFFVLNALVVFVAGFLFDWDRALYTMASIFVSGKVIDAIHTSHIKLTLTIITSRGEKVKEELLSHVLRGITIWSGVGAYSKSERDVLYTVCTRYELNEIKEIIQTIDPYAFINITQTVGVVGTFRKK
ncbi:YitT family protein [Bacillus sp. Marseille-P3661]|uniref:YitT family protein n=1 Tax=Bacillus sp. Marseille-P3661 TaxID=1936234 RepID=UPI002155D4C8|nr:YitT family protein [Bacillus sp. Marseille-P3661]